MAGPCAEKRARTPFAAGPIQGNHLHLIVEVESRAALSRAMQVLSVRIARRLNALAARKGAVFADRFHARALVSRREVAIAVRSVLRNFRHHTRERLPARWEDPLSSARFVRERPDDEAPVVPPRTWLLRIGWLMEGGGRGTGG